MSGAIQKAEEVATAIRKIISPAPAVQQPCQPGNLMKTTGPGNTTDGQVDVFISGVAIPRIR